MKKTKKTILCIAMFSGILIIGISVAYMFKKTDPIENTFTNAVVSCEIMEDSDTKSGISVKNTGNVPAYLRVRLVTWWEDENKNIVGKPSDVLNFDYNKDWIKVGDTYYYKAPVNAGSEIKFTSSSINSKGDTFNEVTVKQVIHVISEAIQSEPRDAVTKSWKIKLNDGYKITDENTSESAN